MSFKSNNKSGFTLVELAIVLVIIGLLVGGVLQGQELIKQAQIRSTITELSQFDTAVNTFRAKYRQIPGDISKAAAFGLNCPDVGAVCTTTTENMSITTTAGADGLGGDGDADGSLESSTNTATAATRFDCFSGEIANFWTMLSNALLVKGGFYQVDDCDGVTGATLCASAPGVNMPDAPVGKGAIALTEGGRLYYVLGTAGSYVTSGLDATGSTNLTSNDLTPDDAFAIDSKLDDGVGSTGVVQAISQYSSAAPWGLFTRVTGGTAVTDCHTTAGVYNLTNDGNLCTLKVRGSS